MSEHFSPGTAVVGLVFVALGTVFLLDQLDVVRARPTVILPILLIGLGVGLLVGVMEPSRNARRPN